MPSSTQALKFLLDENVRRELYHHLLESGIDVKCVPAGAKDAAIGQISLEERRILVTNDSDFSEYKKKNIYGVIWLRLPQNDADALCKVFSFLIASRSFLSGHLTTLFKETWQTAALED